MSPQGTAQSHHGILAQREPPGRSQHCGISHSRSWVGKNWQEQGRPLSWRKWPLAKFVDMGESPGNQASVTCGLWGLLVGAGGLAVETGAVETGNHADHRLAGSRRAAPPDNGSQWWQVRGVTG